MPRYGPSPSAHPPMFQMEVAHKFTCISGDDASQPKRKSWKGGWGRGPGKRNSQEGRCLAADGVLLGRRRGEGRTVQKKTYQYCGKLSLSSSNHRSSSHSLSRSLGFLPSFWTTACEEGRRVMGVGRAACDLCLDEWSVAVTALRTSVMEELPVAWPDFRRWWCIEKAGDWPAWEKRRPGVLVGCVGWPWPGSLGNPIRDVSEKGGAARCCVNPSWRVATETPQWRGRQRAAAGSSRRATGQRLGAGEDSVDGCI